MSYSVRQKLVHARRFDTQYCANQIASIVSHKVFNSSIDTINSLFAYDGDGIELIKGKHVAVISEKLDGEFFDAFPYVEIEVKIVMTDKVDIDGYYYHTLDNCVDDGLIEVVVYINDKYLKHAREAHLKAAIQCILVHEMQHVVQRCHANIEMSQIHDTVQAHIDDIREVDARVEEVLCGITNESDVELFTSKMTSYMYEFLKRNGSDNIDVNDAIQNHVSFYSDKILSNSQ